MKGDAPILWHGDIPQHHPTDEEVFPPAGGEAARCPPAGGSAPSPRSHLRVGATLQLATHRSANPSSVGGRHALSLSKQRSAPCGRARGRARACPELAPRASLPQACPGPYINHTYRDFPAGRPITVLLDRHGASVQGRPQLRAPRLALHGVTWLACLSIVRGSTWEHTQSAGCGMGDPRPPSYRDPSNGRTLSNYQGQNL